LAGVADAEIVKKRVMFGQSFGVCEILFLKVVLIAMFI